MGRCVLWSHWKGPFWVPELAVPHSWHLQCLLERSQRLNREVSLRLAFVRPVCDAQLRIPAHFFSSASCLLPLPVSAASRYSQRTAALLLLARYRYLLSVRSDLHELPWPPPLLLPSLNLPSFNSIHPYTHPPCPALCSDSRPLVYVIPSLYQNGTALSPLTSL